MLNLEVASMVAELIDRNPRLADDVGEREALLDELLPGGDGGRIGAVDDVDIFLGEEIEGPDQLLRVHGGEAGPGEVQSARVSHLRESSQRREKNGEDEERKKKTRKRNWELHLGLFQREKAVTNGLHFR